MLNFGASAWASGPSGPILPRVGPFASNAPVLISSLTNYVVNTALALDNTQNRANPIKASGFRIDNNFSTTHGTIQPDLETTAAIFIWADTVLWNATCAPCNPNLVLAFGTDGGSTIGGCGLCPTLPAPGGAGSSGGGGGAVAPVACAATPEGGGNAGAGEDGSPGGFAGCGYCSGGPGGLGFGLADADGFTYPNGGDGGDGYNLGSCITTGTGTTGGSGYGGAGGGGTAGGFECCGGDFTFSGGGGGSGGLIVIVCNSLTGQTSIVVPGGTGGSTSNYLANGGGGGGGGGVIWIAAKHYDGQTIPVIYGGDGGNACSCSGGQPGTDGTAVIYEINHDGTLGAQRSFSDTWDNR